MSTTLANFPSANNNARPQIESFIQEIAKEGDFFDKLDCTPKRELFGLKTQLEEKVRQFGNTRTPLVDLCRMRLVQLRQHLA